MRAWLITVFVASALVSAFVLTAGETTGSPPDDAARDIVRRSAVLDERNFRLARNYTFTQQIRETVLDQRGRRKSSLSETYDVTFLFGIPYRRLIAKDGHPLPPADEKKQEEKMTRAFAERQRESDSEKQKHLAQYIKRREHSRVFLREVPEAFDFRLLGEETIEGRPAYVIAVAPRPGYKPRDPDARILTRVRGKLWIDKSEFQWIKGEAEITDTVSFGLLLFRLGEGSRLNFQQTKLNDEVWLLRRIEWQGSARLALVKKVRGDGAITYDNYKRFQADTEITIEGAQPARGPASP